MPGQRFNITELVNQHFSEDSLAATPSPECAILLGGPAAGKTTLRKNKFSCGYVVIDAAELFIHLDGWEDQPFPGELETPMNQAGRLIAQRAIKERRNIVTELIGSDFEPTVALIDTLKRAGYTVSVHAVTCAVEEVLRRNLARGNDEISAYFAEPYQRQWLMEAAASARAGE